jgi:3-phytase
MSQRLLALPLSLCLAACAPTPEAPASAPAQAKAVDTEEIAGHEPMLATSDVAHSIVAEAYVTESVPADNLDSPAAWTAAHGVTWVIGTAKEGERGLVVFDGDTGATLQRIGTIGAGPGQFQRPNGAFVLGDRLFVVERDNRRVQVLALPTFQPLGSFGEADLVLPYGMWAREMDGSAIEVLVTDAYMVGKDAKGDDIIPALGELDRRVHRYVVRFDDGKLVAEHRGAFGDTTKDGAIRTPESLWGDPVHDRLVISEEDPPTGTAVREYRLDGTYAGRTLGLDRFKAQAEGIALWTCADGSGYWLFTDQFKDRSVFHVYDRRTLAPLGAFAGKVTANTDGVWLRQSGSTRFPAGVFYAVHDDQALAAFDWRDIASALSLRVECASAG